MQNTHTRTHTRSVSITPASPPFLFVLVDLCLAIQWRRHPRKTIKWLAALLLHIIANLKIISNSTRLTCLIYHAPLFPINKKKKSDSDWCRGALVHVCVHACIHAGTWPARTQDTRESSQPRMWLIQEIASESLIIGGTKWNLKVEFLPMTLISSHVRVKQCFDFRLHWSRLDWVIVK